MPTLHHLQYRAADGVSVNGKSLVANRNTGLVTLAVSVLSLSRLILDKTAHYISSRALSNKSPYGRLAPFYYT